MGITLYLPSDALANYKLMSTLLQNGAVSWGSTTLGITCAITALENLSAFKFFKENTLLCLGVSFPKRRKAAQKTY